jgi:YVTN family beta-propeller protein
LINKFIKIFPIIFLLTIISACTEKNYALITNQGDDSLSIIDLKTLKVINSIETANKPLSVEMIGNSKAVIASTDGKSLEILNLKNFEFEKKINTNFTPLGMAFVAKKNALYVTSWYESKIYIFDTNSWQEKGQINVNSTPSGITFNKKHNLIICVSRDENLMQIIKDDAVIKTVSVGQHPFGITSSGDFAYSVNVYSDDVTEVNLLDYTKNNFKVGSHPYNAIVYKNKIFVTNTQDDSVSIVDLMTKKIIQQLLTEEVPENLDINEDKKLLVVTNWGSNSVSIFNIDTYEHIKNLETGSESRSFGNFIWPKR